MMMVLPARRHSPWAMVLVIAAHGLVLAVLATLRMPVSEPSPKPLMVEVITPQPVAPPQPEPEVAPQPRPVAKRERPQPVATPQPVLATPNTAAPVDVPVAAPAPVAAPKAAPMPAPAVPAPVSAPVVDADYLDNPKPVYPALSRRLREEGKVVLRVFVEASGAAGQVEIRGSSGFERLDKSAVAAVARRKFTPARQGAEAVGAWVLVPIVFSLKE